MAQVLTEEQNLTDIADAIRSKSSDEHKHDTFKPAEMAAAIRAIEGGGLSEVTSVTINNKTDLATITMPADGSYTTYPINVTILPASAPQVQKVLISDPTVCEARENGDGTYSLRPKRGGNFTVTVTDYSGQQTDSVDVSINIPLESMQFAAARIYCEQGQTHTTTLITTPRKATLQGTTYESSNTGIATVDANGTVTIVGPGEAQITARNGEITATCMFESTAVVVDPDWGAIKAAVLDGTSTLAVGSTISDKWTERYGTTTREFDITWRVVHIGEAVREDGTIIERAPYIMLTQALPRGMYFERDSRVAATELNALEGVYYYGFDGTNYTKLEVETGDILPYDQYTAIYKCGLDFTATTAANLKSAVTCSGHNLWAGSPVRQFLNSDADKGMWFSSHHITDTCSEASNFYGFLSGFSAAFLNAISAVKVETARNNVSFQGEIDTTYDKMFLPSKEQMYYTQSNSAPAGQEGGVWDYFKDNIGTTAASDNATDFRKFIPLGSSSATSCWLRTANRASANSEFIANTSGGIYGSNAGNIQYFLVPACVIC